MWRVFDALDRLAGELTENAPTPPTNVKKLTGPDEMWRLRVGDYRLLFTKASRGHGAMLAIAKGEQEQERQGATPLRSQ